MKNKKSKLPFIFIIVFLLFLIILFLLWMVSVGDREGLSAPTPVTVSSEDVGVQGKVEVSDTLKNERLVEMEQSETDIYPITNLVTDKIAKNLGPVPSDTFSEKCEYKAEVFNIYKYSDLDTFQEGFIKIKSNDEYFVYTIYGDSFLSDIKEAIERVSGSDSVSDFYCGVQRDGYMGITPGGYMAGYFDSASGPYYMIAYYLSDGQACAYLTTDKSKLDEGYLLITENIHTMLYDLSALEGTSDTEASDVVPDDDPYIREIREHAKYSNIRVNEGFFKMYLLITANNLDTAEELYLRRMKDDSIIYSTKGAGIDSRGFEVSNVMPGEKFQLVVFGGDKVRNIRGTVKELQKTQVKENKEEGSVEIEDLEADNSEENF